MIRLLKSDQPAPTDEECDRILEAGIDGEVIPINVLIDANVCFT